MARKWAAERKQWGAPIGEHQAIAIKLSFIALTTLAMDVVTWFTSHIADAKKLDIRLEAAMAKLFCTEAGWRVVDETLQIRGGRGFETAPSLKGRGELGYAVERAFRDARVNLIIEGSSQIMRLFIAPEALDLHLKRMLLIFSHKTSIFKKIRLVISLGFWYLFWFTRLWLPTYAPYTIASLNPYVKKHVMFVQAASKCLARVLFLNMLFYQQRLEAQQNVLARLVDIGTDLFAMSRACSYARLLSRQRDISNTLALQLAGLFCLSARQRILRNFKDTWCNQDKNSLLSLKRFCAESMHG